VLRQRTIAPQLIDHRTPDTRVRKGLELNAAAGIKIVGRFDESKRPGGFEILHVDILRQLRKQLPHDMPHHREMFQDQLIASTTGSNLPIDLRWILHAISPRNRRGFLPSSHESTSVKDESPDS